VQARRRIAEGELRAALAVPEPERVAGRRVLVFDDVYSEGFSLREMARALRQAGAVEVAGLVLAPAKAPDRPKAKDDRDYLSRCGSPYSPLPLALTARQPVTQPTPRTAFGPSAEPGRSR
jgi:hypothetical protein